MRKYKFKTNSVNDYRPLRDMKDIGMPWWCSGVGEDYAIIICYLQEGDNLFNYWDDAYDIEHEDVSQIIYTDRFPKPSWL